MRSSYQTPARQALLALFAAHPDRHYTAEQVCRRLCDGAQSHPIGKSTVYRQLTALCDQKLLRRFDHTLADGTSVHVYQYSALRSCDEHFHMKCRACGRIAHLECDMTASLLAHIRAEHSFEVDRGASVLYGLCGACAAKSQASKEDKHDR